MVSDSSKIQIINNNGTYLTSWIFAQIRCGWPWMTMTIFILLKRLASLKKSNIDRKLIFGKIGIIFFWWTCGNKYIYISKSYSNSGNVFSKYTFLRVILEGNSETFTRCFCFLVIITSISYCFFCCWHTCIMCFEFSVYKKGLS